MRILIPSSTATLALMLAAAQVVDLRPYGRVSGVFRAWAFPIPRRV